MRTIVGTAVALLLLGSAPVLGAPAATSCTACHSDPGMFEGDALKIPAAFGHDVHGQVGLSCHDCHGGNPDPALREDPAAMDPGFAPNPYRGAPARGDIPAFCGRCHSDPNFMRRFRPDIRVDQEREYRTSHHGTALARGDTKVATCVDCHGVHGIRRISDPDSPVYPKRVAETCRACHGDPKRMAGYTLADGRPLPVDQYAHWRQSVHARALLERDDLSAPTCNDCHGNHGATPPGVDSVAFVCGQCHGREAELFRASVKQTGFEEHNALLASAGPESCASCHSAPEPQAARRLTHFTECATCHSNHAVVRPSLAMLGSLPATPCAFCHEGSGPLANNVLEPEARRERYRQMRDGLLAAADRQRLKGDARFDWLVDQALALPTHTLPARDEGTGGLRPEFERLFTKFRIGKTTFTYDDPVSGKPVRAAVVRCPDCHAAEPMLGSDALGHRTAGELLGRMQELTALTARAERILLAARRGGVETRQAVTEVDGAVDAQIELEVLVHTFSADPKGAFVQKHAEGVGHARAALAAGQSALGELGFRRKGLAVSLVLIVMVLIGLAMKIREISHRDEA
ncbi:MAG: hypothetical protein ACJ76J_02725 [Thermoanaerobaculia bacterium]